MKKLLALTTAGLLLLGIAAALATAETSVDEWKPANTQFKALSQDSSFATSLATAECGTLLVQGKTPLGNNVKFSEAEAQQGVNVTPQVAQCKPTETVVNGPWHISLHSLTAKATCGAKEEPAAEDDCITIKIPNEGAKIKFGICEAKVNANTLTGVYDDDFELQKPTNKVGRAEFKELLVGITGCGGGNAKFKGNFIIAGLPLGGGAQGGITDDTEP